MIILAKLRSSKFFFGSQIMKALLYPITPPWLNESINDNLKMMSICKIDPANTRRKKNVF